MHTKYTFYNPDQKPEKSGKGSAKKRKPDSEPGKRCLEQLAAGMCQHYSL